MVLLKVHFQNNVLIVLSGYTLSMQFTYDYIIELRNTKNILFLAMNKAGTKGNIPLVGLRFVTK